MRRSLSASFLCLLAAACSDYSISGDYTSRGRGEPPPLETPTKTDRIVQSTPVGVDVLWVVDNSCSMADKQQILANNFPSFIDMFIDSDLDWHVGVVTTDVYSANQNGKLRPAADGARYLDPTHPDPATAFKQMAKQGTNGSSDEMGLAAANHAIEQTTPGQQQANAGFYRDDAALHIVIVSDEQDFSPMTVNEFVSWIDNLKTDADIPITFSSIVEFRDAGCGPTDGGTRGGKYLEVTNQVGGVASDICLGDWSDVLAEIGEKASGRKREFFLSEVPVEGTIEVTVRGKRKVRHGVDLGKLPQNRTVEQACEKWFGEGELCFPFEYDSTRNSVYLTDWMPNPLDEVDVTYQLLSGLQEATEVVQGDTDAAN